MAADRVAHSRVLDIPPAGDLVGLRSPDPLKRDHSAAYIGDMAEDGLGDLAPAVAGQLLLAFLVEDDRGAAVAALDALGDVCFWNEVPALVLKPLADRYSKGEFNPWEKSYLEAILDEHNPAPPRDSDPGAGTA